MSNKILNIGQQTTNLLSNDNLIVYSDVSMQSKFNPQATTSTIEELPNEEDYFTFLATENNDYLSVYENEFNLNELSIAIHANNRYIRSQKQYINKMSLSKYRIEKNINVKAVQTALHNIFSWIPGERILNPEFGSTLYRHLYNGITEHNTEQIMAEIRKNISDWEPRVQLIQVKNISNVNDTENNTVHLELVYSIPSLNNEQYSYTYVYHKQSI